MSSTDWRWKIGEAVERIRSRYDYIGRKTGAPFLAIIYPPGAEAAVFHEWHTQIESLRPDYDVRTLDILQITQGIIGDIGVENIVESLKDPMPGSDPTTDLGSMWVEQIAQAVRDTFTQPGEGRPVVCLERLAALYPPTTPRGVMQQLWDSAQSELEGPVVILIPGTLDDSRTYRFVDKVNEFMYRGDLL